MLITVTFYLALGTIVLALLCHVLAMILCPEAEKVLRQRAMARVFGDNGFLVGR
jgi:hypothetical protein